MDSESLWVIKVGGSLYELPDLGLRLRRFLTAVVPAQAAVMLVPGGGATANVIRELDARHGLGEERAHFLALQALSLNAHFLACLLPEATVLGPTYPGVPGHTHRIWILDSRAFMEADERLTGKVLLPHVWDATSDSVAARAAVVWHAERLVLLKSVTIPPGLSWEEASRQGFVDPVLPQILRQATTPLEVTAVNLRSS